PLLPHQCSSVGHSSAARAQGRHCPSGLGNPAAVQSRVEEKLYRIQYGGGGIAGAISLAGKHSRTAQRDRADHDSVCGRRDRLRHLPEEIRDQREEQKLSEAFSSVDISPTGDQFLSLRALEDNYIEQVLTATGNNKTQAARILGIHPTSLQRRLKVKASDYAPSIKST